jgi:hypothetical protein
MLHQQLLCFDNVPFSWGVYPLNEEIMNSTPMNTSSTIDVQAATPKKVADRCQHRFANGKRCRNSASQSHFGLCLQHFTVSAAVGASQQVSHNDSTDFSAELIGDLTDFESAVAINKFLTNLLALVSKGRISPRRAAVLAYITNQLLHTHRAIDYDDDRHSDGPVTIIMDGPRPDRSQDEVHSPAIQRS